MTRERHDARSNSRRSTPSTSIAPDCGSYSRHSSLASVVLPAPFWPTIASDEPAGIVEIEAFEHRRAAGIGERHVAEADVASGQAVSAARRAGDKTPNEYTQNDCLSAPTRPRTRKSPCR